MHEETYKNKPKCMMYINYCRLQIEYIQLSRVQQLHQYKHKSKTYMLNVPIIK